MVKFSIAGWVAVVFVVGVAGAETFSRLAVTADRVCLRAKADGESEVVWQVSSGTVLQGTGQGSNWIEVLAPAEASVWIASNLVNNGVVQVPRAHVRAGPGLNYPAVGSAQRGDKVDVRGQEYGWVKIGPPASCRLWVSSQYVRPVRQEKTSAGQTAPQPAAANPVPERPVEPVSSAVPGVADSKPVHVAPSETPVREKAPPAAPPSVPATQAPVAAVVPQAEAKAAGEAADLKATAPRAELPAGLKKFEMEPGADQGRQALYRGTMDKCNWLLRKPAEYRLLVKHPRRGIVTLCYVSGDPTRLASLDGKRVEVSGREYRLKGVERPVVVYESVVQEETHSSPANLTGAGTEAIMPP